MTVNAMTPVGQFVVERPARSRVFEQFGLDYCCGGKLPLAEACRRKGLDVEPVLAALAVADADAETAPGGVDPAALSLTDLCDHIVETHHAYLRDELPRLEAMTAKVAEVHHGTWPWVVELAGVFRGLHEELTSHMMKEEMILFPAIRSMESGQAPTGPCGHSLQGPIDVMEHEHDSAGNALARLRDLSSGYTPPEEACNTFRAMLDGLAELEADLHEHIHKENNILFPRALSLTVAA